MKFTLTINCDNAAFGDPDDNRHNESTAAIEVSRILRHASVKIRGTGCLGGRVMDVNGNTVGKYEVSK